MSEKNFVITPPQREDASKIGVVPGRTTANTSNTNVRNDGRSMQSEKDKGFLPGSGQPWPWFLLPLCSLLWQHT